MRRLIMSLLLCTFAAVCAPSITHAQTPPADLMAKAEAGDADAQYSLGETYYKGYGVRPDRAEATKWYRKAAEAGNVNAQFVVGQYFWFDQNDRAEAMKWYRKAAEAGNADAQFELATIYQNGNFGFLNQEEASKWTFKAADNGHMKAVGAAMLLCLAGVDGHVPDLVQAYKWMEVSNVVLAETSPDPEYVHMMLAEESPNMKLRQYILSQMTPEQIVEAEKLAKEWMAAHSVVAIHP